jgi:hypothetical protein
MVLAEEFKFKNDLQMENHFRYFACAFQLFIISFIGGSIGLSMEERKDGECSLSSRPHFAHSGDWRELLAATKSITFFRMVKRRPEELLLQLFNIYSLGAHRRHASRG